MRRTIVAMVALLAGLGGCVTQTQFAGVQEAAKGSPALRERALEKCVKDTSLRSLDRQDAAAMMNVPANADLEKVLCRRIIGALSSGRMTYDDYNAMARGEMNPRTVRIIQGR